MPLRSTLRDLRAIQEAKQQQRIEVAAQLAKIDAELEGLQVSIDLVVERLEETGDVEATQAKVIRNAIVQILVSHRSPLHYTDIFERLQIAGIEVKGKDPLRNVSAHLSNDQRFTSIGKGYWGLASWPAERLVAPTVNADAQGQHLAAPELRGGTVVSLADRVRTGFDSHAIERIRRNAAWAEAEEESEEDESEDGDADVAFDPETFTEYLIPAASGEAVRSSSSGFDSGDIDDVPF